MRTIAPIVLLVLAACDAGDAGEPCKSGADCERSCIAEAVEGQEIGDLVPDAFCQGDDNIPPVCWNTVENGKIEGWTCI